LKTFSRKNELLEVRAEDLELLGQTVDELAVRDLALLPHPPERPTGQRPHELLEALREVLPG